MFFVKLTVSHRGMTALAIEGVYSRQEANKAVKYNQWEKIKKEKLCWCKMRKKCAFKIRNVN